MASSFLDVCRFNPTVGGTTDWTYSSAVTGYQGPTAAGAVNGAVYSYRAESNDLSQWEVGYGAYNSSTGVFARTTILFNSSGTTSKINFSAVPQVAIVALAEDLLLFNTAMSLTSAQQDQVRSNIGMAKGHIPGSTGAVSPAAGEIGEYKSGALGYGSAMSLSNGTGMANLTSCSVSLTAGIWSLAGLANFESTGAVVTSYTSISTDYAGTDQPYGGGLTSSVTDTTAVLPSQFVTLTTTTTVNLKAAAAWSGGSGVKCWGRIWAVRIV